ncbi:MAG: DUF455 family protein [Candidatus Latescibacterota bacterium]
MQIRELAERILFGDRWEDKLVALDRYEDSAPGTAFVVPERPGRPVGLGLDEWHGREKMRFRDVGKLHSERERGLVLHFFANHELLALELMALALLKFPDAPQKFRRGVVQTLKDEQEHVRMYRRRMDEIGVEFGQIPVSDYFWKAIAPMRSPSDFVTGLSLTLEQANLDYAVHYAGVYEELGDESTAAILRQIYKDEISHVKHGLVWFERWRSAEQTQWDAYQEGLPEPLSPARAKGIGFNREGRLKVGFDRAYIDELEVFSRSRGRCPNAFWFNPNCEGEVAVGRPGDLASKQIRQLANDLRALPMLYCAQDDVVLVERRPSIEFLRTLRALGFTVPEFVECGSGPMALESLVERKLHGVRPWGWSPQSAAFFAPLADQLAPGETLGWQPAWRALYSKAWSADHLRNFMDEAGEDWMCGTEVIGRICQSVDGVESALAHWTDWDDVVIKAAIESSGRGQIHARGGRLRSQQRGWLENVLARHGQVVVEPWLDKALDLSLHFDIDGDGQVHVAGWTRFFTDQRGQYRGTFVSQMVAGLDDETKKFLYGDGRDPRRLRRLGEQLSAHLGSSLAEVGYVGPVCVDALVYRCRGGLRFKPIVEINPRTSMGRVALSLRQRVNSARTALWLVVTAREAQAAGYASLAEWASEFETVWPARLADDGAQVGEGALFVTDPAQAGACAGLLLVDQTLSGCRQRALELGLDIGA